MEQRMAGRIDQQGSKVREWKPGVVIGGLLALAGLIVTIGAAYQLQVTGEERRAQVVSPAPATAPTPEQLEARRAVAELQLERDRVNAALWRARVDAEAEKGATVRCYNGVRMIKRGNAWSNEGRC